VLRTGRTKRRLSAKSFNPHRARRPGAARPPGSCSIASFVSILTGPGGPVLPMTLSRPAVCSCGFNPHRARRPGATTISDVRSVDIYMFQSSPGPEARCYVWFHRRRLASASQVSILTGPGGPVLRRAAIYGSARVHGFQSSPGPEARCYLLLLAHPAQRLGSFNPHRARRPGATRDRSLSLRPWE